MARVRSFSLVALAIGAGAFVPAACSDQADRVTYYEPPAPTPTADAGGDAAADAAPMCPHQGPPVIDPSGFPACPMCGGGRCIPTSLLPAESAARFADCDDKNKCVPELILTTGGNFIPATCRSAARAEGRCLSRCIPSVAAKAESLPQDVCRDDELCVPCFDPFTQEPTGACLQSCDPGPTEPAVVLNTCCAGDGVCLPTEDLGAKAEKLGEDICPQNEGPALCVPSAFLAPGFKPMTCVDENAFGPDGPGVCLPECLPAFDGTLQDLTLDREGCPVRNLCAPCENPITGEDTGACEL